MCCHLQITVAQKGITTIGIQQLFICSSIQPFGKEHKEEGEEEEEKQKQISSIQDMNIQLNHTHFPPRVKQFLKFRMNLEQPYEWLVSFTQQDLYDCLFSASLRPSV